MSWARFMSPLQGVKGGAADAPVKALCATALLRAPLPRALQRVSPTQRLWVTTLPQEQMPEERNAAGVAII